MQIPIHPEELRDYHDNSEFDGMSEDEIEAVKDERTEELKALVLEDEKRERHEMTFSEEGQINLEIAALQRMWPFNCPMPDPWE